LSPLSFLWLEGLESRFPGFEDDKPTATEKAKTNDKKPKLNVKNTVAKIIVDQVIGGAWNTVAFIATMGVLRGQDYEVIKGDIQNVRILLNWGFLADVMFLFEPTRNQQFTGIADCIIANRIFGRLCWPGSNCGPLSRF
jgi:hypothetical protein